MSNRIPVRRPFGENKLIKAGLLTVTFGYLGLLLGLPLVAVFTEALRKGLRAYGAALVNSDALSAIKLTLFTAAVCIVFNTIFGLAAAWTLGKFRFRGRGTIAALIGLPFAVSPVASGLIYVLVFGRQGWLGPWLQEHDIKIIFAAPGVILATLFVTFPFIANELIPLMRAQGADEELAAATLGAGGWAIFRRVTIPNIKWGLIHGIILCNARAVGEFGAVSVVSGHIRGRTNTLPLHIEVLYNEYDFSGAFACASVLTLLALGTLGLKALTGARAAAAIKAARKAEEEAGPL